MDISSASQFRYSRGSRRPGSARVSRVWRARPRDRVLSSVLNCAWLSQREGGAAYNLSVDDDIHAIGADSERAGTQIVYVLTTINPEV